MTFLIIASNFSNWHFAAGTYLILEKTLQIVVTYKIFFGKFYLDWAIVNNSSHIRLSVTCRPTGYRLSADSWPTVYFGNHSSLLPIHVLSKDAVSATTQAWLMSIIITSIRTCCSCNISPINCKVLETYLHLCVKALVQCMNCLLAAVFFFSKGHLDKCLAIADPKGRYSIPFRLKCLASFPPLNFERKTDYQQSNLWKANLPQWSTFSEITSHYKMKKKYNISLFL